MAVAQLDATRGDENQYDITVTLNGAIFNLTGCLLVFTGKYSMSDADPGVFQIRSDGSNTYGTIAFSDAPNGKAQITLNPVATTALLPNQVLVYDLQLKDLAGKVSTVAKGTMFVEGDVTVVTS